VGPWASTMSVNQSFLATACRKLSVFLVKKGVICKLCDIFEFHCSPSPASSHLPDNCWTAAAARLLLLLMLRCCWALNGCLLHACTPDAPPTQILCICSWTKRTHAHARAHTHTHTHTCQTCCSTHRCQTCTCIQMRTHAHIHTHTCQILSRRALPAHASLLKGSVTPMKAVCMGLPNVHI